jgi:hypothetical protein
LDISPFIHPPRQLFLALADFEHLGAARGACALGSGFTILHFDAFRILHLFLGSALYTISLHSFTSFLG